MKDLLRELCRIPGVSGNENLVSEFARKKLAQFCKVKIENDNSVIASIGEENAPKHILFDAHIDSIGLIVTHITKEGFIKFDRCGGVDPRVLYGKIVTVHGKKDFNGIICSVPPHLKTGKEKSVKVDELFIDLGIQKELVVEYISYGDRISFGNEFFELLNDNIASPYTDDRAGVCILIKLAEKLSKANLKNIKVSILLSSREEIGMMGAKVSSYKIQPNEGICVDVSFAKQPGVSNDRHSVLGGGPMIGIASALSKNVSEALKQAATKADIPYQLEVMGGKSGTNADLISLSRGGVPCGLVSVPQRYMHSGTEVVNIRDMENITSLLFEYCIEGGAK